MDSVAKTNGQEEFYELEDSGERFLPGVEGKAETAYDHIARYRFASRFLSGQRVADLGSGSGYGSHAISRVAESVRGVDLSDEAVAHASSHYVEPNLNYQVGDVTRLPFDGGSFDAVVSFEVIEHLGNPEDLVVEAKRVIKEHGVFIVSSPDKQTYSNERNSVNLYHPSEMYAPEFRELLERHFSNVEIYRQGAVSGSLITRYPEEIAPGDRAEFESTRFSLAEPSFGNEIPVTMYMIAVCSNSPRVEHPEEPYVLLDRDRLIYEDFEHRYINLRRMLDAARHHRNRARELLKLLNNTPSGERVERERRQAHQQLQNSQQQLQNNRRQAERLKEQLENTRRHNEQLKRHVGKIESRLHAIEGSRSWRVVHKVGALRERALELAGRR